MFIAIGGLWPLIAFAGGQGYSVLLMLAAVLCLRAGSPGMKLRLYMIVAFVALEFIAASARWSPRDINLIDINLAKGSVAIRFEVLRLATSLLFSAILISAAKTLTPKEGREVVRVVTIALLVQLIIVAVLAVFEKQLLQAFTVIVKDQGEGVQNISRNGIIMALAAPFLIVGMGRTQSFSRALFVEIAVFVAVLAVLLTREVQNGIVSVIAGLLAVAVVRLFPRHGFRILGATLAFIVVSTPIIFGFMSRHADALTATNSFEWRLAIWQRVIDIIQKDPIFGQGLGVLRTIDERIPSGVFKGEMFVPNHAHNAVLQLWAESGAIGASLVAITILLAGFRMPEPRRLGVAGFLAAALAGQFMAIALASFDLWNDWWWACAGLLAALTVVMARAEAIDDPGRMLASATPTPAE